MSPSKSMDAIQTYEEYYVNRDYEQLSTVRKNMRHWSQ